jgi:hypothetical protein
VTAVAVDRAGARPGPVPVVLGLQEGRRIVLHPLALVGLLLTVLPIVVIGDNGPRDAFDVFLIGPGSYYGVLVYFAGWFVASRDRRTRADELLAATPTAASGRVAGLCLAALAPAAVCAAVVLTTHAVQSARGLYVVAPGAGHLAQPVVTVLGGALLGIMVARLTRVAGAAVLVMIAMIAVDVWLSAQGDGALLGTFMTWTVYAPGPQWTTLQPGSAGWHSAYLLALCAMAACGAFLREAAHRWRALALGAASTAAAVVAGLQQLP